MAVDFRCGIETSRIYSKRMALKLCLIAGAQVMCSCSEVRSNRFLDQSHGS